MTVQVNHSTSPNLFLPPNYGIPKSGVPVQFSGKPDSFSPTFQGTRPVAFSGGIPPKALYGAGMILTYILPTVMTMSVVGIPLAIVSGWVGKSLLNKGLKDATTTGESIAHSAMGTSERIFKLWNVNDVPKMEDVKTLYEQQFFGKDKTLNDAEKEYLTNLFGKAVNFEKKTIDTTQLAFKETIDGKELTSTGRARLMVKESNHTLAGLKISEIPLHAENNGFKGKVGAFVQAFIDIREQRHLKNNSYFSKFLRWAGTPFRFLEKRTPLRVIFKPFRVLQQGWFYATHSKSIHQQMKLYAKQLTHII